MYMYRPNYERNLRSINNYFTYEISFNHQNMYERTVEIIQQRSKIIIMYILHKIKTTIIVDTTSLTCMNELMKRAQVAVVHAHVHRYHLQIGVHA